MNGLTFIVKRSFNSMTLQIIIDEVSRHQDREQLPKRLICFYNDKQDFKANFKRDFAGFSDPSKDFVVSEENHHIIWEDGLKIQSFSLKLLNGDQINVKWKEF